MKTKIYFLALLTVSVFGHGQVSVLGNVGAPVDYVGWGAGNFFPLRVEHQGPFPIDFSTSALQRMRITSIPNGAPVQNYIGALLNPLPGDRLTRITINRDGLTPIGCHSGVEKL